MPNEKSLENLRPPWKPGESGNPDGKPKGIEHSKTRLLKFLALIIKSKNQLLNSEEEIEMSVLEKMDMGQIALAISGDTKAYKEILDRLEGKPIETVKQSIDLSTEKVINISVDGKDIDLSK